MAERLITRTVYGSAIQVAKQLGLKHTILDYTTVNEAVNNNSIIGKLPDVRTRGMEISEDYDYNTDTDNIYTQWMVIGNQGHLNFVDPEDAIPYSSPIPHKATDSGLYNFMPFLMREVSNDLTRVERARYGLRRTVEVEGVLYAAYYARKLDFNRTSPDMMIETITNGESQSEVFIPTFENLRPAKPPALSGGDVVDQWATYNGVFVHTSMVSVVVFSASEIQDLKDAARLMFGNERKAIISEIGICSAVEKQVTKRYNHGAGTAQTPINVPAKQFYEAVGCQINAHITTYIPISYVDQEYTFSVDLGASEPIFGNRYKADGKK